MQDLCDILRNNSYPGRGIVVGRGRVYYFIMGRSSNSRNRIFVECEDGIRTQAHDPAKLEDPSLIIYHPVRRMGEDLVVTNGDQTDTIVQAGSLRAGCLQRCYEPDAPNYTPRISAVLHKDGSCELSILKRLADLDHSGADAQPGQVPEACAPDCLRAFYAYPPLPDGLGVFISTYQGDGNPLPSFAGEPLPVNIPEAEEVWDALNTDNKVSLYANVNGTVRMFNKHHGA